MNPAALAPLAPTIIKLQQERNKAMRPVRIILGLAVLGTGGYFLWRYYKANDAANDLATNPNARTAAMYMKVLDEGGLLQKLLAKVPGVSEVNKAIDTVSGWFGKTKSQKVNLITSQVLNWEETVGYFKSFTSKSLNKVLKSQLTESEYQSFVNTLGANTKAVDAATGRSTTAATVDSELARMIQVIMSKTPGQTFSIGNAGNVQNWKVTSSKNTTYWKEPGGNRKSLSFKPGDFLGNPTGRFQNFKGKEALAEFRTKEGLAWGIVGHHTIWVPKR